MFDAQCDLAALVYDEHQDPDTVLRDFADDLNAHGFRAVGMLALVAQESVLGVYTSNVASMPPTGARPPTA